MNFSKLAITVGKASIGYGAFIQAVIDFLIVAFCIFCLLKAMNKAANLKKQEEEAAPTTKMCPYCKSEDVPIEATRCPHCTSQLEAEEKAS